jgi:hypothetical protein
MKAFDHAQGQLAALAVLFRLKEKWGLRVTFTPDGKLLLGPAPIPPEALDYAVANKEAIRRRFEGTRR